MFEKIHSELYDVDFWINLQNQIRSGFVLDVFPYRRAKRFERGQSSELEVFAD
jgi:isocitrate dehydrogenase kinase/phosphatase